MKNSLYRTLFSIVIALFALICESAVIAAPRQIEKSWGMNAHLVFDSAKPHMKPICEAMKNAGAQIVRIDVYWAYDNLMAQQNVVDSAVFFATKNNLEILLNFPTFPSRRDSLSIVKWCNMLASYARRYDGRTAIRVGDEVLYPNVRYFEAMNEIDFFYKIKKFDVAEGFNLIKKSSLAIRMARPDGDAKVVLPGLCSFESFVNKLLMYKDFDGKTLADFIDIMSYHDYNKSDSGWDYDVRERIKSFSKVGLQDKEVWLTEFGTNMYETTFAEQAAFFTKRSIVSLAYGIDKVFYYQFHYYGGNTFDLNNQREDFYGMVDTGIKNSYVEFLENRNDGKFSIMTGCTPIRIYITEKNKNCISLHSVNKSILKKLKSSGLKISGKRFSVDSIAILPAKSKEGKVVWNGFFDVDENMDKSLALNPEIFTSVQKNDRILVYVENVENTSGKWESARPFPVYEAYSFLTSLLVDGSTIPQKLSKKKNQYAWRNPDGTNVLVVWCDFGTFTPDTSKILDSDYYIYDVLGKRIDKNVVVKNSPIFFVGKNPLLMRGF